MSRLNARLRCCVSIQSAEDHFSLTFDFGKLIFSLPRDQLGSRIRSLTGSSLTCSSSTDAASISPVALSVVSHLSFTTSHPKPHIPSILAICVDLTILTVENQEITTESFLVYSRRIVSNPPAWPAKRRYLPAESGIWGELRRSHLRFRSELE